MGYNGFHGSEDNNLMEEGFKFFGDSVDSMSEYLKKEGKYNPWEEDWITDTYALDKLFAASFVNDEMYYDFDLIAKDFFLNEYENLLDYEPVSYKDYDTGDLSPDYMFFRFVMSLIVNAIHGGSEYSKALVLYLFKTYYRKEYKDLKRFSTLSRDEVIALAKPKEQTNQYSWTTAIARILFISRLMGIEIKKDCNSFYMSFNLLLNDKREEKRLEFCDELGKTYQDTLKEVEEKFNIDRLYKIDSKVNKFLGKALNWAGYNERYVDFCDEEDMGLTAQIAETLNILRKTYPSKKDYTEEELVLYGTIFRTVCALTCNNDFVAENMHSVIYGENDEYYDDEDTLFHPEEIKARKSTSPKPNITIEYTKTNNENALLYAEKITDKKKYLEEITELTRKVHKLQDDNEELKEKVAGKRKLEEENKELNDKLESATRELAALRTHVYNLTESEEEKDNISYEDMKEALKDKRIIVIGGHSNWVSKVKIEFPSWTFINPSATGSTDTSIVDKADKVYFFTDLISHSTYYRYMNIVKERKVNFGYIHGVNVEKNIRQIYREMVE